MKFKRWSNIVRVRNVIPMKGKAKKCNIARAHLFWRPLILDMVCCICVFCCQVLAQYHVCSNCLVEGCFTILDENILSVPEEDSAFFIRSLYFVIVSYTGFIFRFCKQLVKIQFFVKVLLLAKHFTNCIHNISQYIRYWYCMSFVPDSWIEWLLLVWWRWTWINT